MMIGVLLGIEGVICDLVSVERAWRMALHLVVRSFIATLMGANIEAL